MEPVVGPAPTLCSLFTLLSKGATMRQMLTVLLTSSVPASNLIHSGMFDVVENEAQLAAVADRLSRNVANAVLSASGRRSHGIPNVDRGRPGHWSRSVNRLSCLHKTQSRTDPEACSAGAQPSRALNRV